jgi:hypothetical protein
MRLHVSNYTKKWGRSCLLGPNWCLPVFQRGRKHDCTDKEKVFHDCTDKTKVFLDCTDKTKVFHDWHMN